ncbi:MAG: DUF309 domain-containing protein [Deltaproteobacteria bacterium]|jgi:hypothetical protein|nr:DUF309 domain-containing protein [Deltaproteobacteria bacterium]
MDAPDILQPERYTAAPFPRYRYIPFQGDLPHPRNDPEGHSFGLEEEDLPTFTPKDWTTCQPYLYGVDLFNYGYCWEAHEAWETVWLAAGRETLTGNFVQGLIQIAAAQLKRFMQEDDGAQLLTATGIQKLSVVNGLFLGIECATFIAEVEAALNKDNPHFPLIRLHPPPKP